MQVLDTTNPELSEQNVFEQLFSLLERQGYNLQYSNANIDLARLHEILEELDDAFAELNVQEGNSENIRLYNSFLNHSMPLFINIFDENGFKDEPIYHAFKRYVLFFSMVIKEGSYIKNPSDVASNFYDNFISLSTISPIVFRKKNEENYEELDDDSEAILLKYQASRFSQSFPLEIGVQTDDDRNNKSPMEVYLNDNIQKTIEWDEDGDNWKTGQTDHYFMMRVEIDAPKFQANKLLDPLWHITTALSNVKDLRIELKSIKKGSLITRLKVLAKEPEVIEEAKAVLQTGIETVTKVLSGGSASYTEVKTNRLENQKTRLEIERLDKELKQMPTEEEAMKVRNLELKTQLLDVEKKQIENASAKLDLLSKLSDLVAKGILEADMIRVDVDDVLRLLKTGDEIQQIGPDITEP